MKRGQARVAQCCGLVGVGGKTISVTPGLDSKMAASNPSTSAIVSCIMSRDTRTSPAAVRMVIHVRCGSRSKMRVSALFVLASKKGAATARLTMSRFQGRRNAAEAAENRKNARVAREFEIALPQELMAEQRIELTRDFAQDLADRYGAAVDFAIHAPHDSSDIRNHHAHLLMTTRQVTEDGLGDKTNIERENKWLLSHDLPTSQMQLRDVRKAWEVHANEHLARAGLEIRIDHR